MEKRRAALWFRIFALCTAVALGGAYVWWQQKQAARQEERTGERAVMSGSKSRVIAPATFPVEQEETDRTLMPGSKSGAIELKPKEPKQRTLLPGSKSPGSILEPLKTEEP